MRLDEQYRYLAIMADGELVTDDLRIRISGKSTMSLLPDLYTVGIYNLSPAGLASIKRAEKVSVIGKRGSVLCECKPSDILHCADGTKHITTLMMIDGEAFWDSTVSLSLRSGTDYITALRTILAHSTHRSPLASVSNINQRMLRGLSCYGRTAGYVDKIARTLHCRAYSFRDTVNLAMLGEGTAETVISEADMLEEPTSANGVITICTDVVGLMVGRRVTVDHPDVGGIWRLIAQQIDADNLTGSWRSDLVLIDERKLFSGWEGGL